MCDNSGLVSQSACHALGFVTRHHHDILDARSHETTDDRLNDRAVVIPRQQRLGLPHPRGHARRQDDRGYPPLKLVHRL